MKSNNYLAIDLNPLSSRIVLDNNGILHEIHRFDSYLKNENGNLVWDIQSIYKNIIFGIKKALELYNDIASLAITSWAVDYVLLCNDKIVPPVFSFLDQRVNKSVIYASRIMHFEDIYKITGIQFAKFNTLYQLKNDIDNFRLKNVTDFLSIPEYLSYLLTGKKIKEYTMASTSGMIDLTTNKFSDEIIRKFNFPKIIFPSLIVKPGYVLGDLKEDVIKEIGKNIKVIMCASHSTASMFEALDVDENTVIITSNFRSIVGVKIPKPKNDLESCNSNFTNEAGTNYICYSKNIMGMWVFNEIKKICKYTYNDVNELVRTSTYEEIFDINDQSLVTPVNMKDAVIKLLKNNPPNSDGDIFRSIYYSLANSYKIAIKQLENNLKKEFNNICVVGGVAKNTILNKIIQEVTGKNLIAKPLDATVIGNIKIQKSVKLD